MSMIKVRLKPEFGKFLILTSPLVTFIIKEGGENDPSGFEVDKEFYEGILKPYVEPVPKRRRRRKEKKEENDEITVLEQKSEDEIITEDVEE